MLSRSHKILIGIVVGAVALDFFVILGCGSVWADTPPAPMTDQVPAEQGGGAAPLFAARRTLDAGAAAADKVIGDVAAAQGIFSVLSGDSGSDGQASK